MRSTTPSPIRFRDDAVRRRAVLRGVGVAAAAAVLAACRVDGPDLMSAPAGGPGLPPSPDDWDGARVDVSAIDNTFRPQTVEVAAGTMVVWTNGGRNEHDVIAVDGTWGIALEEFPPDAVYGHVFTEPGEHPYYCTIHGTTTVGMVGTIVVTA